MFSTFSNAPREAPYILANLKQELYEERVQLRRARRRGSQAIEQHRKAGTSLAKWSSAANIRVIDASIKQLCMTFAELEKPFLSDGERTRSRSINDIEKRATRRLSLDVTTGGLFETDPEADWENYTHTGFSQDYADMSFWHRWAWVQRKSDFLDLSDALEKLQVRRITREVTDALGELKAIQASLQELKLVSSQKGSRRTVYVDEESSDENDTPKRRLRSRRRSKSQSGR